MQMFTHAPSTNVNKEVPNQPANLCTTTCWYKMGPVVKSDHSSELNTHPG